MPGTLVGMPGVLPDGEPVTGGPARCRRTALGEGPAAAGLRLYVARPVLRLPLRVLRTSTPTRPGEGVDPDGYADRVLAELALAGRVLDGTVPAGEHRVRSAAVPRPCWRPGELAPDPGRHRPHLGSGPGRRG